MSSQDNSNSSNFQPNKSKRQLKNDDWTEVTEPEERRRIQNRIAQRKFREKTRENKERAEREARNRTHAAASYRIPTPSDIPAEPEVSGLPWGGISMAHVVSRGHDSSRNASGSSGMVNQQQQPHQQQHHQQHMGNVAGNTTGNPGMMGQYGQYGGTQGAEYGYEGMDMEQREQEDLFKDSAYKVALAWMVGLAYPDDHLDHQAISSHSQGDDRGIERGDSQDKRNSRRHSSSMEEDSGDGG